MTENLSQINSSKGRLVLAKNKIGAKGHIDYQIHSSGRLVFCGLVKTLVLFRNLKIDKIYQTSPASVTSLNYLDIGKTQYIDSLALQVTYFDSINHLATVSAPHKNGTFTFQFSTQKKIIAIHQIEFIPKLMKIPFRLHAKES